MINNRLQLLDTSSDISIFHMYFQLLFIIRQLIHGLQLHIALHPSYTRRLPIIANPCKMECPMMKQTAMVA